MTWVPVITVPGRMSRDVLETIECLAKVVFVNKEEYLNE